MNKAQCELQHGVGCCTNESYQAGAGCTPGTFGDCYQITNWVYSAQQCQIIKQQKESARLANALAESESEAERQRQIIAEQQQRLSGRIEAESEAQDFLESNQNEIIEEVIDQGQRLGIGPSVEFVNIPRSAPRAVAQSSVNNQENSNTNTRQMIILAVLAGFGLMVVR